MLKSEFEKLTNSIVDQETYEYFNNTYMAYTTEQNKQEFCKTITPSKITAPNARENWLEVQARCLHHASILIVQLINREV